MSTTQTTPKIYKAIVDIMADAEAISKDKLNQQQGFKYRGIDDLYNVLQPKFAKHGVFITSEVIDTKREERQTKNGGMLMYTILTVKFTFFCTDGSSVTSIVPGEAMDSADKSTAKAMSIALKYCLFQLLLIRTEELQDPDAETHEPKFDTGVPDETKLAIESAPDTGTLTRIHNECTALHANKHFMEMLTKRKTELIKKQPKR